MNWIECLKEIVENIDNVMYVYVLTAVLIIVSIYFTFKTRLVQIKLFPNAVRLVTEKAKGDGMSSFQALMISTAARVGTGCIAGIATAIVIGGAGAVFWMWIVAIIASSMTFIECTLAQMYKIKDGDGFRGGPAYYIERVLKKRWFGVIFSVLLILSFGYGFIALQSHMISNSLLEYIPCGNKLTWEWVVGLVLCILTGFAIFGGSNRIGFISSYLVPIMAIGYMCVGLVVIIINIGKIPSVFVEIFTDAFNFRAVGSGAIGAAIMEGLKKGTLSHESGMGSAANAAATAHVSHPVKQGLVQVFSVFITTFLVCTTTAFIVLLSGINIKETRLEDITLVQEAIRSQVGYAGQHFITLAIFFFAFSTIVGDYAYAETNVLFVKNSKMVLAWFRVTFLIMIIVGAILPSRFVWSISEIFMGLMAFVNIIAIVMIGDRAIKCMNDYIRQRKAGLDPVFVAKDIGLTDTDMWK